MNTMKEKPWTVLVISVILQCFGEVDAHSIHLDPSPRAEVEEGKTLSLHCSCNESNTPDYINWYLNNDTFGLVIEASSCNYLSTPGQYEIDRYSISCHETKFNLSIASISKDKDHQVIWKCDTTVIGMVPPQKSSTTIVVIDAVVPDADKKRSFHFVAVVVSITTMVVILGIAAAFIVKMTGIFSTKKSNVKQFGADVQDDAESVYENRNDVNRSFLRNLELPIPDENNGKQIIHGLQIRIENAEIVFDKREEPLPDSDDENESLGTE